MRSLGIDIGGGRQALHLPLGGQVPPQQHGEHHGANQQHREAADER